ncbi:MAG: RluA family pseudouridine synthase [Planctomycetota bacterium]
MAGFIKPLDSNGRILLRVDPAHAGMRLDSYLALRMPWRTRSSIQQLIRDGKVILGNRPAKVSRRVLAGDVIEVLLPPPKRDVDAGLAGPDLRVLYEDADLVAVDKPPGIPVHPAGRLLHRTIITALRRRYAVDAASSSDTPKLCHRLDLETSGVLLVAKTDRALVGVSRQFRERRTQKLYLALVYGELAQDEGAIDYPIGKAVGSLVAKKRAVRLDVGQPARTRYRVQRRLPGATLLEVELLTGRHHQIRVHLAAIGHPVVGDKIYGPDESYFLMDLEGTLTEQARRDLMLPRQALHSYRLALRHPRTDRELEITAPLAQDIAELVEQLAVNQ